tara:strand:+ start:758 stop:1093 length:336 start_codon:yes stop_codon:yes gene_type:complete
VYLTLLSICFFPIRAANSLKMGASAGCIMVINQLMQETPSEIKQFVNQYIYIAIPHINEHVADIKKKYGGFMEELASKRVAEAKKMKILWFETLSCMRELEKDNLVRPLIK